MRRKLLQIWKNVLAEDEPHWRLSNNFSLWGFLRQPTLMMSGAVLGTTGEWGLKCPSWNISKSIYFTGNLEYVCCSEEFFEDCISALEASPLNRKSIFASTLINCDENVNIGGQTEGISWRLVFFFFLPLLITDLLF